MPDHDATDLFNKKNCGLQTKKQRSGLLCLSSRPLGMSALLRSATDATISEQLPHVVNQGSMIMDQRSWQSDLGAAIHKTIRRISILPLQRRLLLQYTVELWHSGRSALSSGGSVESPHGFRSSTTIRIQITIFAIRRTGSPKT